MNIGDVVYYDIDPFPGTGIIIGRHPKYDDIFVVADDRAYGMTVNQCHCRVIGGVHEEQSARLRSRYLAKFPGMLA